MAYPDFFAGLAPRGRAGLDTVLAEPERALVAFDYDGTLAPIVDDPAAAVAQPGTATALAGLASRVGHVAVITGRPARTVVDLAGFSGAAGLESLVVLGQYGLERWSAATGEFSTVPPPAGLAAARAAIPGTLAAAGVSDAEIEDKGLAVAVHVRRSADPDAAFDRLCGPLTGLAERTGLAAEPGRFVVELRPKGMDKGKALVALADEVGAGSLVFTGDDLGDLAAFDAVEAWRATGGAGLLVCSGSDEVVKLADRADLVVDGPPGVLNFVEALSALLS